MEKNKARKIIFVSVILVVVLVGSIGIVSATRNKQRFISVNAMTVESGNIMVRVPANGVIEEVNRHLVTHDSVSKVLSVEVKEGDAVKAGQVLANLEGTDIYVKLKIKQSQLDIDRLDLERLENQRERTEQDLIQAKSEAQEAFEQNKTLFEAGAISKVDYDKTLELLEKAESEYTEFSTFRDSLFIDIEKMKIKIEISKLEIEELLKEEKKMGTKILSPIDGIVTKVSLEKGMSVSPTNPSFIVSDLSELKVDINVSEYDISKVRVGQTVEINSDAIGTTLYGEVSEIAPIASNVSTGQVAETVIPVTVKLFENSEGVKPGFSVRTRIICEQKENIIVVPFDTIISEQNGAKVVWVITENDTLKKVEVQTGLESDFELEVIEGLKLGDRIVLDPSSDLKEDIKVDVNESK